MKFNFDDILSIEGVQGVFLISNDGRYLCGQLRSLPEIHTKTAGMIPLQKDLSVPIDWTGLINAMGKIQELELIFEKGKCYIQKSQNGHLVVILDKSAPTGMIRLNCEILLLLLPPETHT